MPNFIIFIYFLLTATTAQSIKNNQIKPSINEICTVNPLTGLVNKYPSIQNYKYLINFNQKYMQANYVAYISAHANEGKRCLTCKYFRKDPYNINILRNDDYNKIWFQRGHLVPNADHGNDTYIISNVTPMLEKFNNGPWKLNEAWIRQNYGGKLTIKGCDYNHNDFLVNDNDNKMFIPTGCYYVIFDISILPEILEEITGTILDYGYYRHANDSEEEKKLPYWITCQEHKQIRGMHMLKFEAGDHVLTNRDYMFVDSFVVEMWSGGSDGFNATYYNRNGGGSGGYIKTSIMTNQQKFRIHVGKGGDVKCVIGGLLPLDEGYCGGKTLLVNNYINLTIAGGTVNIYNCSTCEHGGKILAKTGVNVKNGIFLDGNPGIKFNSNFGCVCQGGNAPFGGHGLSDDIYVPSGNYPGGGAGCTTGKGADGLVIIYLST